MRLLNDRQCLFLLGICEDLNDRIPGIVIILCMLAYWKKWLKSSGKIPLLKFEYTLVTVAISKI